MITVSNSRPEAPRVALFGQLDDGSYAGELLDETSVLYAPYWENAVDQVMVYIEPEEEDLQEIVKALNDGRLHFSQLQDYGGTAGGTSTLPI